MESMTRHSARLSSSALRSAIPMVHRGRSSGVTMRTAGLAPSFRNSQWPDRLFRGSVQRRPALASSFSRFNFLKRRSGRINTFGHSR
jgi:hypothetical protein